jgi:hypothetical protein
MGKTIGALALVLASAALAESSGDYATDLGRVYAGYQRILAMKEACDAAVPAGRARNEEAFAAWLARHRELLRELDRRVTAMIRRASRDEKEYARNFGKYHGAILQERREYREMLLALGAEELRAQCEGMPEQLKSPAADLARVYAAELEFIRKGR